MGTTATINVRMPSELKRNGSLVLDRAHVSPTELVKSVYRYMAETQAIPECLDIAQPQESSMYDKRRKTLREVAGTITLPIEYDVKGDRASRIEEKYGDLL